jgi:hypothetical protein
MIVHSPSHWSIRDGGEVRDCEREGKLLGRAACEAGQNVSVEECSILTVFSGPRA